MSSELRGSRRSWVLGATSLLLSNPSFVAATPVVRPAGLQILDWSFRTRDKVPCRSLVLVPDHLDRTKKHPVLVLFHGLGEAKEGPLSGVYAWLDPYGLGSCYERLRNPPVAGVEKRPDLRPERAAEINRQLNDQPFRGMIMVCPFTPNVWTMPVNPALDTLTSFVVDELLPAVNEHVEFADTTADSVGVDGCSLGAFVSLEVFRRRPERFGSVGVVQPAIGKDAVGLYADAVVQAKNKGRNISSVHVETSTGDVYVEESKALVKALEQRGIKGILRVPPGSHDQPFLRDVGTLEMLLYHDTTLHRVR